MSKRKQETPSTTHSKKKKRNLDPKLDLRFEDYVKGFEEELKEQKKTPKSKKLQEDIENFATFQLIDTNKIKLELYDYLEDSDYLNPVFCHNVNDPTSRTGSTFEELVDYVFNDELLDEWIYYNVYVAKRSELPAVMYREDQKSILFTS